MLSIMLSICCTELLSTVKNSKYEISCNKRTSTRGALLRRASLRRKARHARLCPSVQCDRRRRIARDLAGRRGYRNARRRADQCLRWRRRAAEARDRVARRRRIRAVRGAERARLSRARRDCHQRRRNARHLRRLVQEMQPREPSEIWTAWAFTIARLGYEPMRAEVARVFSKRWIEETSAELLDFYAELQASRRDPDGLAGFGGPDLGLSDRRSRRWKPGRLATTISTSRRRTRNSTPSPTVSIRGLPTRRPTTIPCAASGATIHAHAAAGRNTRSAVSRRKRRAVQNSLQSASARARPHLAIFSAAAARAGARASLAGRPFSARLAISPRRLPGPTGTDRQARRGDVSKSASRARGQNGFA